MTTLTVVLVALISSRTKATIFEEFESIQEEELKYSQLITTTVELANENAEYLSSPYIASIGVSNYVRDQVLKGIKSVLATPHEKHGVTGNVIIFMEDDDAILITKEFAFMRSRGRYIICVTSLYSNKTEFIQKFTKVAIELWVNRISQVLLIGWTGQEINIFGITPYQENVCFPTSLVELGSVRNGIILKKLPTYQRLRNLHKCPLRVATTNGMPYVEIFIEKNVTQVRGIEGNLLNVLSSCMNFTPLIFDAEKEQNFNFSVNDIKHTLKSNKSDICFAGKKVTIGAIEFSIPIMDCKKVWIVPKAQQIPPWMLEILPFQKWVWITLVFVFLLIILITYSILNHEIASLLNMWSLFLGVPIELATSPARASMRIYLTCWIILSYVMTRSYLASMEGFLTTPSFLPEIDTYEQLVSSKIVIQGHPVVQKLFHLNDTNPIIREIAKRYLVKSKDEIFAEIGMKNQIDMAFNMKADILQNSKFLRKYEYHVMKEILLQYPTAFLVQSGAPFLDEMNKIISRLVENGFINLWIENNILIKRKPEHYPERLKVRHISGILIIAQVGYTIAIVVFFIEYLTVLIKSMSTKLQELQIN